MPILVLDTQLAWRMLLRDWRSGELRILSLALIIAVSSVTAVEFFVDRVQKGMYQQATELLAADAVVRSNRPIEANLINAALRFELAIATTTAFRSMLVMQDKPHLVEVKAVSASYPLRGTLRITDQPFSTPYASSGGPARGELWLEPRLSQLLNISPGTPLALGQSTLKATHILDYEPDRGGDMFSIAPRVLMHEDDVAATQLIQTGSLVNYRLLLAGPNKNIKRFQAWFAQQSLIGLQLQTIANGRPEIRTALARAQQFLGLSAIISVLLAGVAIAMATRHFSQRHLDSSAILRCLGATQARIIRLYLCEMLMLTLLASTIACLIAYIAQFAISQILDRLFLIALPPASLQAVFSGYATGIILLLGFALAPLMVLKNVPPLRVLQRNTSTTPVQSWLMYVAVIISMSLLMVWQTGELILVLWLLAGLIGTILLLALCAYAMIACLRRMPQHLPVSWRFGLKNITRHPASNVVQIVALGIGLMVILLLSIIRTDLLDGWNTSLPATTPNHFLINIQTHQTQAMQQFLVHHGVTTAQLYPMVKARLHRINGKPVNRDDYKNNPRAQHLVSREFNLSWTAKMQTDNHVIAGSWWEEEDYGKSLISLETGLASTLGIKLNDIISFELDNEEQAFRVSNIRKVNWDSFNINFFTVVAPGLLENNTANWVTSIYLSAQQKQLLPLLVKEFPNVTIIDVATIISRVREIINKLSLAVEFIFFFTLLAGLIVLFSALQANQDQRRYEYAILRTLGAQKKDLLISLISEFVMLGAITGLLASGTATALAYLLATQVFQFDYQFNPAIIFIGISVAIITVTLSGLLSTRSVLEQSPLITLREL